jgi:serine phosphatase RsbU (regulator of sigma subunit)
VIFDVLEDNNGNLWCSSSVGVFKISKANLFEFWTGGINKIESKLYGTRDGMPEKECTGATPSYISKNGKLLFPTLGGLAILDPYRNTFNELSPPVDIHSFIVDGNSFDVYESNLTLSAGSQRLIFKFSGLSFIAPQKVHFKYKLTGVDKQWVDAQYERQAVYTALSPGEYTFNVIASNNDGVWNEVGKNIKFTLEPHFYQTNWFYAFCILALLGFGHLVYTLRVRQIEHEKKELEKIVKERTAEISQQKEEIEAQRDQLASQSRKLELAYNDIKAVSEIGQEVTSILNFEDLVNATYNHVKSLMYVDYFAIGSYQENSKTLDFDFAFEKNERLPSFQESINDNYRLSVKCLEGKKVIFINSASKEYKELEQYKSLNKNHYGIDTQSVLYVPLVFKEKPVGVLTVQSYRENAYVEQHATILQAMASYISIALENSRNYMIITEKNEQITDSIRYAKTIQQAVLPSLESMNEVFSELMVVYRPKDIVSGDFYWFNHFEKTTFFAVADCTGHGVPGAFMSMIGISILNEIVNVKKITQTDQILEMLNLGVYDALSQEEGKNKDGMDISLCKFVRLADSSMQMEFSGAKRGFWLWQKGQNEMIEIKGTSKTIGGNMIRKDRAFEKHEWLIEKGDTIYMQTDGLADQCNPEREKFGSQNIKEIIARVYTQPLLLQKDTLIKELDEFQSLAKQRDDITFIGLRI